MHYRVEAKAEVVLHYDSHIASFVHCRSYPIPMQNTGHSAIRTSQALYIVEVVRSLCKTPDTDIQSALWQTCSTPCTVRACLPSSSYATSWTSQLNLYKTTCPEINSRLINLGSATLNEVTSHSLELYMSTQFCSSFADIKKNHLDRGSKHLPGLAPQVLASVPVAPLCAPHFATQTSSADDISVALQLPFNQRPDHVDDLGSCLDPNFFSCRQLVFQDLRKFGFQPDSFATKDNLFLFVHDVIMYNAV